MSKKTQSYFEDDAYVKILFRLTKDEDGYPPIEWETLWAVREGGNLYRIDNIPFYVKGISANDIVTVRKTDGELHFDKLIKQQGHSTVRLLVIDMSDGDEGRIIDKVRSLGCEVERSHLPGLVSIDIPPESSYQALLNILEEGFASGDWDYEEANIVHKS